jgi:hypothetical protein
MGQHTVREALLAEILGDIGKLLDEVKNLDARLPALLDNIEKRIVNYEESISDIQSAWIKDVKHNIHEYQDATNRINRELQCPDGIRALIQADIKSALEQVISESRIQETERSRFRQLSIPVRIAIAVTLGMILCGIGVGIGTALGAKPSIRDLSSEERRYMEAGRDIFEVMPRLDTTTRRRLEDALKEAKK